MSNPYFNYRGEREVSTSGTELQSGAAAAAAAQKETQYAQMSLSGLGGMSQQQQATSTSRSGLTVQQVWSSEQGGPSLMQPNRASAAQQARTSTSLNGGPFSMAGGGPFRTYGAGNGGNDAGLVNRNRSDAYLMISKGPNASDSDPFSTGAFSSASRKSAVFDPSDFPSLGGLGGGDSDVGVVGGGAGSKAVNGFGPYSDVYSLGSAYGGGRIKAVDALTANPNGAGFSMQKEDFPALGGGGLGGNLAQSLGSSLGNGLVPEVGALGGNLNGNGLMESRINVEDGNADTFSRRERPGAVQQLQEQSVQQQRLQQGQPRSHVRRSSMYSTSVGASTNPSVEPRSNASPELSPTEPSGSRRAPVARTPGAALNGPIDHSQDSIGRRAAFPASEVRRPVALEKNMNTGKQMPYMQPMSSGGVQSLAEDLSMGISRDENQKLNTTESASANRSNTIQADGRGPAAGTRTGVSGSSPTKSASDALPEDQYGMKGLLKMLNTPGKASDNALLTLGLDLTMLGLDLNSAHPLHQFFETPWIESKEEMDSESGSGLRGSKLMKPRELEKHLPKCYYMQPPALKTSHFPKFSLETLFYIFYSMPRDVLQLYVAVELYRHQWRYHRNLKRWFARSRSPGPSPALERNGYIYFDVNSWEKRPFTESNVSLAQGFLSEEEIRSLIKRKPVSK
eukprot:Plantae.Rhodophyta-Hildenbrandia_rubra.ctg1321.p1 GENE.Plantae.Rhodophyta-Hildenbrandia_rubra.ctg1321~~Plantae.Rhodophyta-Hildenbrandia_rubra.ctg1321.p1  ORF type:complete len:680 (+),score=129.95 Plantae.Rhodophyta-Hildenbrandia_rubra.ctg1321:1267-3306(+)